MSSVPSSDQPIRFVAPARAGDSERLRPQTLPYKPVTRARPLPERATWRGMIVLGAVMALVVVGAVAAAVVN